MKLLFSIFLITASAFADTSVCLTNKVEDVFTDLNLATVDDSQIVTEDDLRFCPEQSLQNAEISPLDLPDNGSVWRVGNRRWTDDWEKSYQLWVKENLHKDFFNEIGLATDCADAAVAVRAIYARMYNLPASFNGNYYSNTSKDYSNLDSVPHWDPNNWKEDFNNDHRFKKAINDWMRGIGTVNIHKDTYQIDLWDEEKNTIAECVAPGLVYLSDGHAETLAFNPNSIMPYRLVSSTMPSEVRTLEENIVSQIQPYHDDDPHMSKTRGALSWNWVINCKGKFIKVKDEEMPYYSEEQYIASTNSNEIFPTVDLNKVYQESLGLSEEQLKEALALEVEALISDIEFAIGERSKLVEEAITYCSANGIYSPLDCFHSEKVVDGNTVRIDQDGNIQFGETMCDDCDERDSWYMTAVANFEDIFKPLNKEKGEFYHIFSTPNRDKRLREKIDRLKSFLHGLDYESAESYRLKLFDKKIDIGNEKHIPLYFLVDGLTFSSQPWDSLGDRWGEKFMQVTYDDIKENNKYFVEMYEEYKELQKLDSLTEEQSLEIKTFAKDNKISIKKYESLKEFLDID